MYYKVIIIYFKLTTSDYNNYNFFCDIVCYVDENGFRSLEVHEALCMYDTTSPELRLRLDVSM